MNPKDLISQTKTLLGKLPNTYTFTKAAAERILKKKRPQNLTICIVRPSIIGAAFRDPYAGIFLIINFKAGQKILQPVVQYFFWVESV